MRLRKKSCYSLHISHVAFTGEDYGGAYIDATEPATKSKEQEFDRRVLINRTRPEKCDKIIPLFQLVKPSENKYKSFEMEMTSTCDRPFVVLPIQRTNMILLVANTLCSGQHPIPLFNRPYEKHYNGTLPCYKAKNSPPYRRGLKKCFNHHVNESQVELCGEANRNFISFSMLSLAITLVIFRNSLHSIF